jgi:hypothetical protein
MKKWLFGCLLVLAGISFSGCEYIDALVKDGVLVEKDIQVEAFDRIVLETSVQLVLENDTMHSVSVEALDFVMPRLKISQNENVLTIESVGLIGFRKKQMPVLTIKSPNLDHIRSNFPVQITNTDTLKIEKMSIVINGRGSFTECDLTLDADYFSLSAYGSNVGNHILRGKARSLRMVSVGLTSMDASQLVAEKAVYVQRSVNPGFVQATDNLTIEMLSSGNVYYSGSADTTITMGEPLYEVKLGKIIHLSE